MGALADFIAREIGEAEHWSTPEIETGRAAKVANLANLPPEPANFSNFSNFSRGVEQELAPPAGPEAHRCACGSIGSIGVGWFLREPGRARWFCAACAPTRGRA